MTNGAQGEKIPRASIGMPVYNGARSLESVLAALRKQTLNDIEIIISDNGSTDDTPNICRRAAESDARIRYFRQPVTTSATDNFNFVLAKACAPYFMWAAHDDYRSDDYLDTLVKALEANSSTILACGRIVEVVEGREEPLDLRFDTRGVSRVLRLYWAALFQLHHLYGVWRTDSLRKVRWEHLDWWHDTPLMMAASMLGDFQYVPEATFFYHFTPSRWFFGWKRRAGIEGMLFDAKELFERVSNLVLMIFACGKSVYRVSDVRYGLLAGLFGFLKVSKQVFDFVRVRALRLIPKRSA